MKSLLDLYQFADADNITIDDFPLTAVESVSYMDEDGECFVAIDRAKINSATDEKTKLSHELGHCATGSFYNINSPADIRARHEERADRWAIKELVPKDELERAVSNGYREAWELADYFEVPEPFLRKAAEYYKMLENVENAG